MNGNCHLIFGTACGISAAEIVTGVISKQVALEPSLVSPINSKFLFDFSKYDSALMVAAIMGLAILGSIFPDIDNPSSHFGKLTTPVSNWIGRFGTFFGHKNEKHRWILHDAGLYALMIIGSCYIGLLIPLLGFFVGIYSHLLLDATNPSGIRIFGKFFRIGKIPSNSKVAVYLTWIFSAAVIIGGIFIKTTG